MTGRAEYAQVIRRRFACSLRDPRYHMLVDISSKFRPSPQAPLLEPRAALILNRFTRTLTIMYATNAITSILRVTPEQLKDKSVYECMQGSCLPEAIRLLEGAKANDSIAYLQFWRRYPRGDENTKKEIRKAIQRIDSEDRGVEFLDHMNVKSDIIVERGGSAYSALPNSPNGDATTSGALIRSLDRSRRLPGDSTGLEPDVIQTTLDQGQASYSVTPSFLASTMPTRRRRPPCSRRIDAGPDEIEAIVLCTSDGLVVVLRRGRPALPL